MTTATSTMPPPVALLELMNGYWITQAIAVAAELGVADELAGGPRRIEDVAAAVGADPRALRRLARALAMIGVLDEGTEGRFGLTPLGDCLRDDAPGSLRALARMRGSDWQWRAWRELGHSVRTGETAFDHVHGMPMFDYLTRRDRAAGELFDRAMISHATQMHTAAAHAYDFGRHRVVVDVGAGYGTLLEAVLGRHSALQGVAFDLPPVLAGTRERLGGLGDRCEFAPGDFFDSVPAGGDAYLLSHIVHDWDDDRALAILRNCRRAITGGGRLLVLEMIVPDGPEPHFSKLLDLEMLVQLGGRERTLEEYRELLAAAGFEITEVVSTPTPVSVIVAVPA
jgi:SAM-dependent methyltransferase